MKIGVLDCDDIAPELVSDYPSYPLMFEALLKKAGSEDLGMRFDAYKVCHGEFPVDVNDYSAYLITGSKTGVYDDVEWREPLRRFIQEAFDTGAQLVGICFGHQLLADVLGGKATKSEKGWGIGAITHERKEVNGVLGEMPETLTLLFSHQDQVVELPRNATRLYGSDFCENGAFSIGNQVLAFQGHPEFTKEYSERLMRLRESRYPPEIFQSGLASLSAVTEEDKVARWMLTFLSNNYEKPGSME
jgi:GMP synthase-like glutamine amidotransferase